MTIAADATLLAPAPPPPVRVQHDAPQRALTVLVVDNDATIIEATALMLTGHGHRVLGAGTIAQALTLIDQADLALIDYDLDHGENGLTLIDRVRRRAPQVALAMISAAQDRALIARLNRRGVPFLAKPVAPDDLLQVLARVSPHEVEPQ